MTNAEIIKALECCINNGDVCDNCPRFRKKKSSRDCVGEILREALALINRQQVEIEKLKVVEHGHWIPQYVSSRGLADIFECSVCNGHTFTSHKYPNCPDKYCRHCGAKMEKFGISEELKGEEK